MEHLLIHDPGCGAAVAFARGKVAALRAAGVRYSARHYRFNGITVFVRLVGDHEYIHAWRSGWMARFETLNPLNFVSLMDRPVIKAPAWPDEPVRGPYPQPPSPLISQTVSDSYAFAWTGFFGYTNGLGQVVEGISPQGTSEPLVALSTNPIGHNGTSFVLASSLGISLPATPASTATATHVWRHLIAWSGVSTTTATSDPVTGQITAASTSETGSWSFVQTLKNTTTVTTESSAGSTVTTVVQSNEYLYGTQGNGWTICSASVTNTSSYSPSTGTVETTTTSGYIPTGQEMVEGEANLAAARQLVIVNNEPAWIASKQAVDAAYTQAMADYLDAVTVFADAYCVQLKQGRINARQLQSQAIRDEVLSGMVSASIKYGWAFDHVPAQQPAYPLVELIGSSISAGAGNTYESGTLTYKLADFTDPQAPAFSTRTATWQLERYVYPETSVNSGAPCVGDGAKLTLNAVPAPLLGEVGSLFPAPEPSIGAGHSFLGDLISGYVIFDEVNPTGSILTPRADHSLTAQRLPEFLTWMRASGASTGQEPINPDRVFGPKSAAIIAPIEFEMFDPFTEQWIWGPIGLQDVDPVIACDPTHGLCYSNVAPANPIRAWRVTHFARQEQRLVDSSNPDAGYEWFAVATTELESPITQAIDQLSTQGAKFPTALFIVSQATGESAPSDPLIDSVITKKNPPDTASSSGAPSSIEALLELLASECLDATGIYRKPT